METLNITADTVCYVGWTFLF